MRGGGLVGRTVRKVEPSEVKIAKMVLWEPENGEEDQVGRGTWVCFPAAIGALGPIVFHSRRRNSSGTRGGREDGKVKTSKIISPAK